MAVYTDGCSPTARDGWQTACTVCRAGTVAVVAAAAAAVTVAVAVAVAAAVAGGQRPPPLLRRLFLLRVLPPPSASSCTISGTCSLRLLLISHLRGGPSPPTSTT